MAARRGAAGPGGLLWRLVALLQLCGGGVAASRLRLDRQADASASAPAAAPGASASAGAQHPQKSFAAFVATHGRQYRPGSVEYWRRQSLFERRQAEAAQQNERPDRLWTAGVNAFADWTAEELRQLRGYRPGLSGSGAGAGGSSRLSALSTSGRSGKVGPSQDWRHLPVLQKPKDQGSCGSCWAIAAATLVEAFAQKANPATAEAPSVQQLVACTPNPQKCGGGGGCTGATIDLALDYALAHGVSSESQWPYRPYEITGPPGSMSQCPASASAALQVLSGAATPNVSAAGNATLSAAGNASVARLAPAAHALSGVAVPFTRYEILPKNDYTSLLQALYEMGPVGVSVAASTWYPYQYGIWDACPEPAGAEVDHAVVAVAYGQQGDGKKYWTLMNSWGLDWGENGYIRLLRRDDDGSRCATNHHPEKGTACLPYPAQQTVCGMCGILFESVVPVL